jgi:hypothetical protein
MSDGTVGSQPPTPDELHHRLLRTIFNASPAQIGQPPLKVEMRHRCLESEPSGDRRRRSNKPAVSGWHSEEKSAQLLGEHIQTRRRKRQRGIGPKWVRHGRDILYPDGAEEEYLAELMAKAEAEHEPRRRGRPRSKGGR